jgi:type II secretory pathway pseudopilin PulG
VKIPRERASLRPVFSRSGFPHFPRQRSAFSLIELLVTLGLLIVLVVMWHGFGSRSNQQRQKRACEKNLLTIYMALELYANEHEERFPVVPSATTSDEALAVLVPRYTVASETFVCPGSKDSGIGSATPLAGKKISYVYFMGRRLSETGAVLMADRWIDSRPKPKGATVFSTDGKAPGNNHHQYGGNFLTCDGEVRSSGPASPMAVDWASDIQLLGPR